MRGQLRLVLRDGREHAAEVRAPKGKKDNSMTKKGKHRDYASLIPYSRWTHPSI